MESTTEHIPASKLDHDARDEPTTLPAKQGFLRRHILNLPLEITLRVFAFLAPPRLIIEDFPTILEPGPHWFSQWQEGIEDLLIVSFVCREWRRICLSAPLLWNTIWISDDKGLLLSAKACIKHSENTPLEITIGDGGSYWRWRKVSRYSFFRHRNLSGSSEPSLHPILHFQEIYPRGPLDVKTIHISSTFPPEIPSNWFESPAPALKSLTISAQDSQSKPSGVSSGIRV